MAFREVQFPACISYGAVGGPGWNTDVVTVRAGHEQRNANWIEMRHRWEVAQAVKTQDDFNSIRAFFLSVRGRLDGFRFKDWSDYTATAQEGVVRAAGEDTSGELFQLQKAYESLDVMTLRDISKPIAAGLVVYFDGVEAALGVDYTLDATTGIITWMSGGTEGTDPLDITWSGEFDTPARFDIDELRAEIVSRNQESGFLYTWQSVPIVEIRL